MIYICGTICVFFICITIIICTHIDRHRPPVIDCKKKVESNNGSYDDITGQC
jgi:hypothetical protein